MAGLDGGPGIGLTGAASTGCRGTGLEAFSVAGRYDLVLVLRTKTNEQIADLVTSRIRETPYITRTETLMAFKAFSRDDLSAMFSIGGDEGESA